MARPLKKQSKKLAEMLKNKHPTTYRDYAFFYKDMLCFDPGAANSAGFVLRELLEPYFFSTLELDSALRGGNRSIDHNTPNYLLRVTTAPAIGLFVEFMSLFKGHVFLIGSHRNPTHDGAPSSKYNKPKLHQLFAPVFELQSDHSMWQMFCRANHNEKFMLVPERSLLLGTLGNANPDRRVDLQMFNFYLKGA
jgi:hypothetical protein